MEYIDIICEDGMPTGIKASRSEVHRKGLWHRTVHVWMFNEKGDVLLQKRSGLKESHPGLWDISCAGHISAGETSMGTAIKELNEELGVIVQEKDLELLFSQKIIFILQNGRYIDREVHDTYLLKKNIPLDLIKIQKLEVECVKYMKFEDFMACVTVKSQEMVQHTGEYGQLLQLFNQGDLFSRLPFYKQ